MHLTPNQRSEVVAIYFKIIPSRSINRAALTSQIAAQQKNYISEIGVKRIISKDYY